MGHVLEAAHLRIGKVCLKKAGGLVQVPCLLFFSAAPSALCGTYTSMYGVLFTYLGGGSPAVSLLDRVESKTIRLINNPSLTSSLDSLSLRRKVASLSLFYRYCFGHSLELASCIPPPLEGPRKT